jgi:bifunctional non-homologous end joining protein LigD
MAFQRKKPAASGIKAPYPGFIEPELATSIDRVPSGERWIHEIKFDGYRVQAYLRDAAVKVFTRRGNDWTNRFRKIAADAWHISAESAIIDGEVVVPAANGATNFSVLQNELRGKSTKIVMVAFDLLYLNGYDLRKLPLFNVRRCSKRSSARRPFNSARASRLTAGRCSSTHAQSVLKASSPRSATAAIIPAAAMIGLRKHARNARHCRSRASS